MFFRRNNPLIKILSSRIFLIFCLVLILWMGMTFSREAHKKRQIDEELDDIRKEITETEERNKELAGLLEFFKDKTFIEKEARERLNLKKPGENVVIIVDEGEKADSDINIEDTEELSDADKLLKEETEEPKEPSNPEKWWRYIFGKR